MALTDDQWADAVATAVSRFHTGVTTETQMSDEIKAATQDWPTRSLSNSGLVVKISRSLASLTGLIETVGPPDPDAGTIGAMAFDNQALAFYGPKTELGWGDARPIDAGPPGPAIEMRVAGGFIQWRVVGDAVWTNLISVADLTGAPGADGEEVSLQATSTHIQWRLGAGPWQDLIALSALKGADGREVEMRANATHIQWRYVGDAAWMDVIALSAITGAQGSAAWTPIIATISDGERRVQQIVDWTGGDGTKPPVGKYIGQTGLVDTAAEATDIRGEGGTGSGDVTGPASSIDGGLVAFDGSTGTKIKAGPGVGVASAGDLLRRSDGDARYRFAGDVPQSEVTGLTDALAAKADLVDGKVPAGQLPDPPTVPTFATAAEVRAGTADGKIISPKVMADALATVSITPATATSGLDFSTFINAEIVLTGNLTVGPPSGGFGRKTGEIDIVQDATGGRTAAWHSDYIVPANFSLQTTANGRASVPYRYQANGKVRFYNPSKWSA